tara:strand:- start:122 stop:349 length:228 start_codon:yes stop_codon:yes gene_type:complete
MTRQWRIGEINAELNRMLRDLSGCDWCAECGGGGLRYGELAQELIDLEGDRIRMDLDDPVEEPWIIPAAEYDGSL